MKATLIELLAAGTLAAILFSGSIVIDLNGSGLEKVKGSGNVVSETRQFPDFNRVKLEGQGKVFITRGENQSLEVKTSHDILPHIETIVRNGKLIISHKNKNLRPTTLNLFITVNDLKGTSIAGSGEIKGNSRFISDNFSAEISGSGSIDLDLETTRHEYLNYLSDTLYLSGIADSHSAKITGSGKIHAFDMQARIASVSITGSGDCLLTATDQLSAKITGSGDALYKGHPQIGKTITGSGKVMNQN